ncbi:MAG TPA: type II secretion system protein GspC [Thermodesulfobacteriota bacterium]|nr:type II secretion system protein GspC [Thermodesulfobacteriota bacterium]
MILSFLKKYIFVVNLILLAAIALVVAQIVNDKVKDKVSPPPGGGIEAGLDSGKKNYADEKPSLISSRSSYDVILERNIFGLKSTASEPSKLNPDEVPQTTLNLELLGTVIEPRVASRAVVKNMDNGRVRIYTEGEYIDIIESEDVRISSIESCVAVVERNRGPETIRCKKGIGGISSTTLTSGLFGRNITSDVLGSGALEEGQGIKEIKEGVYEVDQKMLDELLSDPNQFVNQARVIPQENGLRFFAIRPNSIFFKIGIRNGDILHRINDVELDNVENALKLFEELRGESSFKVDFTRGGQNLTYEYVVR